MSNFIILAIAILDVLDCSAAQNYNCLQSIAQNPPGKCPTWYWYQNSTQCVCGGSQYTNAYITQCKVPPQLLRRDYCATFENNMTSLGRCPYNTRYNTVPHELITQDTLQLTEQICSPLNRTGLLCSDCLPGLGPAVFSYYRECKECVGSPYGWFLFFVRLMLPLTVLCIIVIVFRINIASPALNGFVLCVQLITNVFNNYPFAVHGLEESYSITQFVADVYGLFSLDFFTYAVPSFCISEEMNMLTVLSLQYIEALYPMVLILLVYICITLHDKGCRIIVIVWRPLHKCLVRFRKSWQIKGSVINAFTTFTLLSYCKFCSISLYLIQPVTIWNVCGYTTNNIYYDAKTEAFSKNHIPYIVLSSLFTLFFVLLPALFILFYQNRTFQKFLVLCRLKCLLIDEMANITQGCFKNGTEPGTRDYRWFAGLYLILRIILVFCINQQFSELIYAMGPTIPAVLVLALRPYRVDWCNILDSIFWLIFSIGTSWHLYWTAYNAGWIDLPNVLKLIPLLYIVCYVAYSTFKLCRSWYKTKKSRKNAVNNDEETIPHRLLYPNEYEPLIATVSQD